MKKFKLFAALLPLFATLLMPTNAFAGTKYGYYYNTKLCSASNDDVAIKIYLVNGRQISATWYWKIASLWISDSLSTVKSPAFTGYWTIYTGEPEVEVGFHSYSVSAKNTNDIESNYTVSVSSLFCY